MRLKIELDESRIKIEGGGDVLQYDKVLPNEFEILSVILQRVCEVNLSVCELFEKEDVAAVLEKYLTSKTDFETI